MCNTSKFKYFPCVVWILITDIPALSSESQNNLMYGFPPNSRPGRDSTLSGEHRIVAAAAFTEHFLTFLCLAPTPTHRSPRWCQAPVSGFLFVRASIFLCLQYRNIPLFQE